MKNLIFIIILSFIEAEDRAVKISTQMTKEQRVALVIGNNDYQGVMSKLSNPINDAKAIKEVLESRGFTVIYKEDLAKREAKKILKDFYGKIGKGGVGLFYFSGHGIELDGRNYLIPIDAKLEEKGDAEFEAISLNQITKKMQNAGNRLNIVVLDACRNDPFSRSVGVGGLAKVEPIGLFVSYATGAGSVASDGKAGENGLFTKYLVENMKRSFDLQEVFQKTREEVYVASHQKQFPAIYNQTINGKFYFTLPKEGEAPTVNRTGYINASSKNTLSISKIKFIVDTKLEDDLSVSSISNKIKNDMLQIVVEIANHKSDKATWQYRCKWLDEEGVEVGEGMSVWQRIFLNAKDTKVIKEIAPVPSAVRCKFYIK